MRYFQTPIKSLLYIVTSFLVLFGMVAAQPSIVQLYIDDGTEFSVSIFAANGQDLLLWLPSESGNLEQDQELARGVSQQGIEVWLADLHGAYFLPAVGSSIDRMPADQVAELIQRVRIKSGKNVYLLGPGRGALLALRSAYQWQLQYPDHRPLAGLVMISPKLFVKTPQPGLDGELMPVVKSSNLPIVILQPENSPWRWKLKQMEHALSQGKSDVYKWILPGIRDRFYYRPDAFTEEQHTAGALPGILAQAIALLKPYRSQHRVPKRQLTGTVPPPMTGKQERMLQPYAGNPIPAPLQLENLHGQVRALEDFRGKVVLVNFWASWCPPCVHEMPSMQRLKNHFNPRDFEILAVNMAEKPDTIRHFLTEKVDVSFPILLDHDGAALRAWKVFAFPTSYVLDRDGKIRFALFGAIDWDHPQVLQIIRGLLP